MLNFERLLRKACAATLRNHFSNTLAFQKGRLLNSPASLRLFSTDLNKPVKVEAKDTSIKTKVKELWNNYGYVAVGTYFGIYVTTLGSIFLGLDFDLFNAASVGLGNNI